MQSHDVEIWPVQFVLTVKNITSQVLQDPDVGYRHAPVHSWYKLKVVIIFFADVFQEESNNPQDKCY